jgi:hypothetical protein
VINSVMDNSQLSRRWLKRAAGASVAARCFALTVIVLAAYPAIGYFAYRQTGSAAWLAIAIGALVCWFGSTLALVLTSQLQGPQGAVQGLLLSIMFRTMLPLAAILGLAMYSPLFAEATIVACIVAFYLLTLASETVLTLPSVRDGQQGSNRT